MSVNGTAVVVVVMLVIAVPFILSSVSGLLEVIVDDTISLLEMGSKSIRLNKGDFVVTRVGVNRTVECDKLLCVVVATGIGVVKAGNTQVDGRAVPAPTCLQRPNSLH